MRLGRFTALIIGSEPRACALARSLNLRCSLPLRFALLSRRSAAFLLGAFLSTTVTAAGWAQAGTGVPQPSTAGRPQAPVPTTPATLAQAHGQFLLALPFTNTGAEGSVDWIGEAMPEILNQRFAAAGFLPVSRSDRAYALDHLGLPADFRPTRASTLRLAQNLDADSVIFGTYQVDGDRITATARILDVVNLRESQPIVESAELSRLPDVANAVAWRVVRQLDPAYPVAEPTFIAADSALRLDAFESYVRGLLPGSAEESIRHLRDAVRLDPNYGPAWLALGDALFSAQDYDEAAVAYGHLTRNDPNALQADFYRGLAYFFTGKYLPAQDAFAFVSNRLPLPEVVNNEGVAAARRGKDGAPFFQQAITSDPQQADYHFNLALAYAHRGDLPNAQKEAAEALRLQPGDTEIQSFSTALRTPGYLPAQSGSGAGSGAGASTAATSHLPLERIKRTYDEAAFRQAAFEMEQMEQLRAATEPAGKRLARQLEAANRYSNGGLLVESEREYKAALAQDPNSAEAYAGLARIRERTGERDLARQLASRSLQLHDNPAAHLVLARLALLDSAVPSAASEVGAALHLDPGNTEAKGLRQAVIARGGQVP